MKWLDEIIDRVNAAGSGGEWATQSRIAVEWTVNRLGLPAVPDDEVVDLVGCLIDEVVRLRDWMQRVTDAVLDWRTKVTGNAGSGCPIDAVVVLSSRLRKSEAEIERLQSAYDGLTPDQYHAGVARLLAALGNPEMDGRDVFTRVADEITALRAIINAKLHRRRCRDCGHVGWYADSRTPYCLCDRCCSWLCDRCRSWDTRRVKEEK